MKKRKTAEQIVEILREAEITGVPEACRKHGISEHTFQRWKKAYSGIGLDEAKRMKQLEDENGKLKQVVAEQAIVIKVQQDHMKKKGWM